MNTEPNNNANTRNNESVKLAYTDKQKVEFLTLYAELHMQRAKLYERAAAELAGQLLEAYYLTVVQLIESAEAILKVNEEEKAHYQNA